MPAQYKLSCWYNETQNVEVISPTIFCVCLRLIFISLDKKKVEKQYFSTYAVRDEKLQKIRWLTSDISSEPYQNMTKCQSPKKSSASEHRAGNLHRFMVVGIAAITKTFELVRFMAVLVAAIGVYGGPYYCTSARHTISSSLNIRMNLYAKMTSTCVTGYCELRIRTLTRHLHSLLYFSTTASIVDFGTTRNILSYRVYPPPPSPV